MPCGATHSWEGAQNLSFSLRSEGFVPTLGTLTFKTSTLQRSPHNIWPWRPMRPSPMRPTGLWGLRNGSERPPHRLSRPCAQHESSPLKSAQTPCERHFFLNCEASVCGAGACGCPPGPDAGERHGALSPSALRTPGGTFPSFSSSSFSFSSTPPFLSRCPLHPLFPPHPRPQYLPERSAHASLGPPSRHVVT